MATAHEIIDDIRAIDEEYTPYDVLNALEDGEFLSNFSWTQAEVEAAYDLVYNIKSWDELKTHGGARKGAGRPTNGCKTVGIRLTEEEHDLLKKAGGSAFVKEQLAKVDLRTLYVFYRVGGGDWDLEITTAYDFCRRHDIEDYEKWKGSGASLEDVMDFEDKRDARDFIELEIDDQEKASDLTYEINAH